jgi:polar amino acid transport system substrate-binding protein
MAQIHARGFLTVGVDPNTMVLAYFNPARNTMQGFEVDIAREIAYAIFGDRNPSRLHFIALLTTQRKPAVTDGTVDLAIDAITMTCASAADVAFSTIYLMAHQRTLVQADNPARSLADLRGQRVCATNGSTALTVLQHAGYGVDAYPVAARTDCLVALQTGVVDAIQSDDAILDGIHQQDPYTKILLQPANGYTDEPYGIAMNKRYPDLVGFVDSVLARVSGRSGPAAPFHSWTSLYREWFTPVTGQEPPQPPIPHYCQMVLRCLS